ncbi:hypothetical protein NL676_008888, partial [Syzygium grande]
MASSRLARFIIEVVPSQLVSTTRRRHKSSIVMDTIREDREEEDRHAHESLSNASLSSSMGCSSASWTAAASTGLKSEVYFKQ